MVTMSQVISGGQQHRNKDITKGIPAMLNTKMRRIFYSILSDSIPNYLFLVLQSCLRKAGLLSSLPATYLSHEETVYDLVNCGPNRRFVVLGDSPTIVSNCQSTGSDLLIMYIEILDRTFKREDIPYTPIIINYYDESIVEVREEHAQKAIDIFNRSTVELNRLLGGIIPHKIIPAIVTCMSEAKLG